MLGKELDENVTPAGIGGMGPVVLPGNGTLGSGDVPAGPGDAEEEYKKKKKKRKKMKHLKTLESFNSMDSGFLTEKIKLGSYYFNQSAFNGLDLPAKGETAYALISHNEAEINKERVSLRAQNDSNIGAGFRPTVLAVAEDQASIEEAYKTQLKIGGTGVNLSFSYGTIIAKGQNVSYTEIDGHLAKGTVK
jgi:hypothetical protein